MWVYKQQNIIIKNDKNNKWVYKLMFDVNSQVHAHERTCDLSFSPSHTNMHRLSYQLLLYELCRVNSWWFFFKTDILQTTHLISNKTKKVRLLPIKA